MGWPASMGSGSPISDDDETITHIIIDRPVSTMSTRLQRSNRKLVQPQWVVDSINASRALPEGAYAQGATLPPHLSPFGEEYTHLEIDGAEPMDVDSDAGSETAEGAVSDNSGPLPMLAAAAEAGDDAALRAAELAAERAGISTEEFDARVGNAARKVKTKDAADASSSAQDLEMNKMLMSNKQRKLYERVRHSERKKNAEVCCTLCLIARVSIF